jgi:hypothetical protein
MPKVLATLLFLSLNVLLQAQTQFFYPFPDCAPDWHITHCYVGIERGIGFIDDIDTVFNKTTTNGVFSHRAFTAAMPGSVILSATVVMSSTHDTLTIKDTLLAIKKPEVELRIIKADMKRTGCIKYAFFDKKTGKKYPESIMRNCFTEVEVKSGTQFRNEDMGSGFEYTVSVENRISGNTILIRCHPLDVRAAYWLGPVTVEYSIP